MSRVFMLSFLVFCSATAFAGDADGPQNFTHRVTGLCYPERVEELKAAMKDNEHVKLLNVNYERAEIEVSYHPKRFSREQIGHVIGGKGFGVKPTVVPWEKLKKISIEVVGLDCKGCSLGAYNVLNRVEGVEQASVDFKIGIISAMIDPEKTNQNALEQALKKGNVKLKNPPPDEPAKK